MFKIITSTFILALVSSATAQVVTGPSPLTPPTSNEGSDCVISWSPDTTGKWTQTNIELMTGDNQNMVHITTVATIDTTSAAPTTYTWTCPDVTVNSAIYFYQFSHALEPANLIWTTRWAIAGATGTTTTPQYATQPDGQAIPWGIGALANPADAKPAPAYIKGQTSSTGASNTTVATTTAAAGVTTAATSSIKTVIVTKATASASAASATSTSTSGAIGVRLSGAMMALGAVGATFLIAA